MGINQRVIKFQHKCINKLNREDAEFFLNVGTIKDLSVFCTFVKLKAISFKDDFELELMLVRYLQILMILSSVSEDSRDEQLVEKFMPVPFECEDIIKMRLPYKDPDNLELILKMIKKRFPLPAYWETGGLETTSLLAATPKQFTENMNLILEFYSTPIVAMMAVLEVNPRDFHFIEELKDLLQNELNYHSNGRSKQLDGSSYIKTINWVIKFNLKKTA